MAFRSTRPFRIGTLLILICGVVSGCVEPGASGVRDEWNRRHAGEFSVMALSDQQAIIGARKQRIIVEPARGFCLAPDSVNVTERSAFILIGDCVDAEVAAGDYDSTSSSLILPRSVPAIITVSISGEGMFDTGYGEDRSLNELAQFLDSPNGRATLGRGGARDTVEIRGMRRIGDGLVVAIAEDDASAPLLSPNSWRGFVDIKGRMVVVGISSFGENPLDDEKMVHYLNDQIEAMHRANGLPLPGEGALSAQTIVADLLASRPAGGADDDEVDLNAVMRAETGSGLLPPPRQTGPNRTANADASPAEDDDLPIPGTVSPPRRPDR